MTNGVLTQVHLTVSGPSESEIITYMFSESLLYQKSMCIV